MKAIQVKFLSCTNTLPSRLKVSAHGVKSIVLNINSIDTNNSKKSVEQTAAEILCNKYNWLAYDNWQECEIGLVGGRLPNGDCVFCFTRDFK